MIIYELSCCESCGKTYKGKFKWHLDGKVTCVDCDNPSVYLGLQINQVDYSGENRGLYNQFSEYLINDLTHLYPLDAKRNTELIDRMENLPVQENMEILYYQYNPYQLVRVFREIAYLSSYYILQKAKESKSPLKEFAFSLLDSYFQLRERTLTTEELKEYWAIMSSDEVQELKQVISFVPHS